MKRIAFVVSAALLAGCGQSEKPAAQAAPPPPPAAPAPINMADVAGMWTVKTMGTASDSVLLTYTMKATASDTGWVINLPGRKPMKPTVMVSGDSVIVDNAKYESVLRKGVTVATHGVFRLKDGKIVGTTIATYSKGPDSVRTLRTEGTKNP
jgi:hypothetical protein